MFPRSDAKATAFSSKCSSSLPVERNEVVNLKYKGSNPNDFAAFREITDYVATTYLSELEIRLLCDYTAVQKVISTKKDSTISLARNYAYN